MRTPHVARSPIPGYAIIRWLRQDGLVMLVLCLVAISVLYPFFFTVSAAFKTYGEYIRNPYGPPLSPTTVNFARAINSPLGQGFVNSALVVVPTVLLNLTLASLAGYSFATMQFKGQRSLLWSMLIPIYVPGLIILLPLFVMMASLGLLNQRWVLMLMYVATALPFSTYFMTNFLKGLPSEIFDAARIDGSDSLRTYWYIVVPLARPAFAAIGTLNFLGFWNELIWALLFLRSPGKRTMIVVLASLPGDQNINIPEICAALLFTALPVLFVFFLLQRFLVQGLTAGAVK